MFLLDFIKHLLNFIYLKIRFYGRLNFSFSDIICRRNCYFEGANKIYKNTSFNGRLGYGSYISSNCQITADIGRFCSIGNFVRTNRGIHPFSSPYVTSSPMFYSTQKQTGVTFADRMMFEEYKQPTIIGNDVWLGANVFFAGGLKIGDGAVILAGAVVVEDVPPYAVVGGVPAKILKYRYDEKTIRFLLKLKWWDFDPSWLKQNWTLMSDINQLKKAFPDMLENESN